MRTEPIGMAVAVLFLLASGQACAGTVGELAEIQAQAILTEAKVRLATAQRQLEGKGETGQVVSAQGQTFAMPVPAAAPTITQPVPPVVRTIYGAGGKMTATFLFPGGYEVDAASGAELPGNYRVESISLDQVVLTDKDGNRVPVGFSSVAPTQPPPPRPKAPPFRRRCPGGTAAVHPVGTAMTNLQIAALVQPSMTQLLTADGGEWEVSKHLQEIMALAADGTLYLSESHQNDIHVLSFIDRLDRRGFRYQLNLTDLQTIHQLYRAVAMDGLVDSDGQRATQMQERVVKIIRKATELRASDVHFVVSPAGTGSKIRFRVDGLLKTVEQYRSQELHELCATIYQSMCDVAEPLFKPQLDQDARMSQAFVEKLNLFGARIATRPRAGGFLMILRLLYDDTDLDSLEQLGYLPEQNALFDRMMRMPYGINILSGPTGSGKSMTLKVTMEGLDKLHGGSKHILTIEDPPEYRIRGEGINQTPLVYDATDPDAERQAWAAGIANGMRLDPTT